jgi:hypothetical protein
LQHEVSGIQERVVGEKEKERCEMFNDRDRREEQPPEEQF